MVLSPRDIETRVVLISFAFVLLYFVTIMFDGAPFYKVLVTVVVAFALFIALLITVIDRV